MAPPPKIAESIPQWFSMMGQQLGFGPDPTAKHADEIWATDIASGPFSSGSDLDEKDYLRLRVIWNHWEDLGDLQHYLRKDRPTLKRPSTEAVPTDPSARKPLPQEAAAPPENPADHKTGYISYVSPENDKLAVDIYHALENSFQGYFADIAAPKDPTRPSPACGPFFMPRYWQGLVLTRVKRVHTEEEVATLASNVLKGSALAPDADDAEDSENSDDSLVSAMASTSIAAPPETPQRRGPQAPPPETPRRGGARTSPLAPPPPPPLTETPAVPRSYPAVGGSQNPPTTDETYVNTALLLFLQTLTLLMVEAGGALCGWLDFGTLDWLADRLSLKLLGRQLGLASGINPARLLKLLEARVDGYLCKRSYLNDGSHDPEYNNIPLAIIEAKPFVRRSGASSIRWQESAEMVCWVASLPDEHEHYGLLQSSASGRKRRLLLSQDRDEIYITIAEYGEPWKAYVRMKASTAQPTPRTKAHAADLSGSDAFVQHSMQRTPGEFQKRIENAEQRLPEAGRTRSAKAIDMYGPDSFCVMNQWGPFRINDARHMEILLRRLIALQVQLLSTASAPGPAPATDSSTASDKSPGSQSDDWDSNPESE